MIYKIDGVEIVGRGDWRQRIRPLPQKRREEGFPGISEVFDIQAPRRPDDIVVAGSLIGEGATVAAARVALLEAIEAQTALQNDGRTHTVHIDTKQWANMVLVNFGVTGNLEAANTSAAPKRVQQAVAYFWRQLRFGGGA